jgi:hypothetical protein
MFNLFLIIYWLAIFVYILGVAAVVYHLIKFQLNKVTTLVTTSIFLLGVFFLLIINFTIAGQIEWDQFQIIF